MSPGGGPYGGGGGGGRNLKLGYCISRLSAARVAVSVYGDGDAVVRRVHPDSSSGVRGVRTLRSASAARPRRRPVDHQQVTTDTTRLQHNVRIRKMPYKAKYEEKINNSATTTTTPAERLFSRTTRGIRGTTTPPRVLDCNTAKHDGWRWR